MKGEVTERIRHRDPERLLTAREVADFMHVHVASVERWSRRGNIRFYRLGARGDMRFDRKDVIRFLNKSRHN